MPKKSQPHDSTARSLLSNFVKLTAVTTITGLVSYFVKALMCISTAMEDFEEGKIEDVSDALCLLDTEVMDRIENVILISLYSSFASYVLLVLLDKFNNHENYRIPTVEEVPVEMVGDQIPESDSV